MSMAVIRPTLPSSINSSLDSFEEGCQETPGERRFEAKLFFAGEAFQVRYFADREQAEFAGGHVEG